jgi:cobalt-zinc-cadmium efflux system outer membrane protein
MTRGLISAALSNSVGRLSHRHAIALIALVLLAGCARFHSRPIEPAQTAAALDARTLDDAHFRAFLEKNAGHGFEKWPLRSWDFETLTLAAWYYQPSLDVARAQWRAAEGGVETAAARPNPTVSVTPAYDAQIPGAPSPWIVPVTFDIPIETAGKRKRRIEQAEHLSESARLNIAATAWQVRANLRSSLIDFTAANEREQILRRQEADQEKVAQSLEKEREAGAVSASDVSQARIALARSKLDLADARQQAVDARVRVAEAVGVPARALDGAELVYDLSARPAEAEALTGAELRSQALTNRADILGALADYAASQSALQLEIAKQFPDVHLGPGYSWNSGSAGDNQWELGLTVELPLLDQNQGPIAEAEAHRAVAAANFEALQAKVIGDIDRATADWRVTLDSVATLESLAADEKKQAQSVAAQLQAGASDQLDVLNAQIELETGELAQLDGRVKLQQSFAALEDAVQRPIAVLRPAVIEQSRAITQNQP